MLLSLIYSSSAVKLFSEEELRDLLRKSQEHNLQRQLTGMLLYHDGNFMQVLEGPDEQVRELFEIIKHDPRHKNVTLLTQEEIVSRQFPDWTMGFRNINKLSPEETKNFTPFLKDGLTADIYRQKPVRAYMLLLSFRDMFRQ